MIVERLNEEIEENFSKGIVLVAKEMGWTIDYILNMPIGAFNTTTWVLNEQAEAEKRELDKAKSKSVGFRG